MLLIASNIESIVRASARRQDDGVRRAGGDDKARIVTGVCEAAGDEALSAAR